VHAIYEWDINPRGLLEKSNGGESSNTLMRRRKQRMGKSGEKKRGLGGKGKINSIDVRVVDEEK